MDQIGGVLDLVRDKLNQYFRNFHRDQNDWAIISNIVKPDGSLYENAKDKVVIFLANIQHETTISTYNKNKLVSDNRYVAIAPPIYINLYLLFYANFFDSNYRDGIRMISSTISFFQQNYSFTQDSLPGLSPEIEKLTFELVNMDTTELSYMYGLAGAKGLPAVLYKVRMIPFISSEIQGQTPAVQGLQDQASPEDQLVDENVQNDQGELDG